MTRRSAIATLVVVPMLFLVLVASTPFSTAKAQQKTGSVKQIVLGIDGMT